MQQCTNPIIGVMGGTFDPIHLGHLRTGIEFRDLLQLDELRLLPCHLPPHRDAPAASAIDRLAMVQLALAGSARMLADDLEMGRETPSWTIDTLRALRARFGEKISLCLLVGLDAFALIDTWKEWQQLLELAHLVVADRPGTADLSRVAVVKLLERHQIAEPGQLRQRPAGHILRCNFTRFDISASRIRELRASGASLRYLLPDPVIDYIESRGLYLARQDSRRKPH